MRQRDLVGGVLVLRAGARPATAVVQFIDDHRDRFGVEPICRVLTEHAVRIAPSGYYAFKKRPVSARSVADAERVVQIERVFWDRNLGRPVPQRRRPRTRQIVLGALVQRDRLHSSIEYLTPIEKENEYYREINPQCQPALGELALHRTPGDSG